MNSEVSENNEWKAAIFMPFDLLVAKLRQKYCSFSQSLLQDRGRMDIVIDKKVRNSCYMRKFDNFSSRLRVLSRAPQEDLTNEFIVSGIIGQFFIQFELGWKLLKELLNL